MCLASRFIGVDFMISLAYGFLQRLPQVYFPNFDGANAELPVEFNFPLILVNASYLHGVDRAVGIHTGVTVPVGTVDFQNTLRVRKPEVCHGQKTTVSTPKWMLRKEARSETHEFFSDLIFDFRSNWFLEKAFVFSQLTCGCYCYLSTGCFASDVVVTFSAGDDDFLSTDFPTSPSSLGDSVRARNNSTCMAEATPGVVALWGAETYSVFSRDVRWRTVELTPAYRARTVDFSTSVFRAQLVRASARTSKVASSTQTRYVGYIGSSAYRAGSFGGTFLPCHSLYVLQTSLPEHKFMGKLWDEKVGSDIQRSGGFRALRKNAACRESHG